MVTIAASLIWRDYVTDGVPGSGAHAPIKSEIRTWGAEVEPIKFDTRAALVAATVGSSINIVHIDGYTTFGDGGDGTYKRGSEPSHALKIQSTDGAWWEIVPSAEGINAFQAGATGDGSTDDTDAIRDALAFCRTSLDQLHFPAGTYKITEFRNTGVSIYGAGKNRTILENSTTTAKVIEWGDPTKSTGWCEFMSCRDLTIRGNVNSTYGLYIAGPDTDNGSWATGSRNNLFENVTVEDIGNGPACRLNAWSNVFIRVGLWDSDVGIEIGKQAHNTLFIGGVISGHTNEAVKNAASVGIVDTNHVVFKNTAIQDSGGTNGLVDISGGSMYTFEDIYTEKANSGTASVIHIGAPYVRVSGLHYVKAGSTNSTLSIVHNSDQNQINIENVICFNDCNEVVKISGTTPSTKIGVIRQSTETAANGVVNDTSSGGFTWDVMSGSDVAEGSITGTNIDLQIKSLTVDDLPLNNNTVAPTFRFITAPTYTVQEMDWQRVGSLFMATIKISWSSLDTADTSPVTLGDMPFDVRDDTRFIMPVAATASSGVSASVPLFLVAYSEAGETFLHLEDGAGAAITYDGTEMQASGDLVATGIGLI